ncbi:MAG: DNA alkylation repair protein [Microbacteriaceae bacterium]
MVEHTAESVQRALRALAPAPDSKRVRDLQWFFKTGPGEYGEGDLFIGCTVPQTRAVAKRFRELPLEQLFMLLESPIHEDRLTALHILVGQFLKAKTKAQRTELFDFYLDAVMRGCVNNWDLVDTSAPHFGQLLVEYPRKTLILTMARSDVLWERRVAMLFSFAHIRAGEFDVPVHLAMILVNDKHDLMHKAVGWMLREIGKRDLSVLRGFLAKYHKTMPRTMLRYAIEKLDADERATWMAG